MARLAPFLLLLLLVTAPGRATADDAALAAKDQEIAALKAELAGCRKDHEVRAASMTTEVQLLLERNRSLHIENTALKERNAFLGQQVADLEAKLLASSGIPATVPTSGGLNQGQETSREQLKYLHYLFKGYKPAAGAPQWPALDGKNFVLWLVAVGQLEKDNEGPLQMLLSPADKSLKFPGKDAYAALTAEALKTQRFPTLTSYAGRRNAAKELAITAQSPPATTALFADLSFEGGALVAFLDGKVKYLNRRELGLSPTDPLVAGPASKSPLLQTLSAE